MGDPGLPADLAQLLVAERLDSQALLRSVTSALSRHRAGTWVTILMNPDPSTSRVVAADDSCPDVADYIDALVAHIERPGQAQTSGMSERVIATGMPIFMPSVVFRDLISSFTPETREYVAQHPPPERLLQEPIGVVVVPMRSRGATIGTLMLGAPRSTGPITREFADWVQNVADRIGVAVENAQLSRSAVGRLERLRALQSLGLALLGSQDLRLTLQVILDVACATLGVDAADVALVDDASGTLFIEAITGFHSTLMPDFRFPIDTALLGGALKGRRFENTSDLEALGAFRRRSLFAREGFQTYRGVPLVTHNKLRGVLEVFDRSRMEPDGEWVEFLEAIAILATIAIDCAALAGATQSVATAGSTPRVREPAPDLTRSERDVLRLVVEGLPNQAIGEQLHASESTVKFHVRRILQKSKVENRTELARKATREGWI